MAIYIDGEVVTKSKLFTTLGIPTNLIPTPREKRFQFPVKVDQDGNKRHLHRLLCNEYSVYVPSLNREVKVRMAATQKKDKDQNFEYFPTDNSLESGEAGEVVVNDEMAYLFWYINPMNRQSPFKKPQAPSFYEFLDNDHIAKVSNSKDEASIGALSIILGANAWSISKLRTLAKGVGISGVDHMTDEVVKSTLKAMAYKDPDDFVNKAESREVAFSGKIQEAIDRNIIQLKTLNGMQRWYLGNSEIAPVQYGIEPRKILDDHLSSKWYMYADEINQLLEGTSVASNLSKPENDEHFEDTEMVETVSEINQSVWKAFLELKADEAKFERIKKYADLDPESPGLHGQTRKAIIDNQKAIEIYRKGIKMESAGS